LAADPDASSTAEGALAGLTRRGLLIATGVASGAALVTTAGAAVPALRRVSVFGVTTGGGPGGVPINTTAQEARVVSAALAPSFRLVVVNGGLEVTLSVAELEAMPQVQVDLPIACVEGWSASGRWHGVRISELLALVDADAGSAVAVTSLQESGPFRATELPADFAADPLSMLAVGLDGEPLSLDHGYPCRLITPNRPGVLQTKWVRRLEVVT
jgi:DMSO/TMAO reductase YedYZ molybdopterin-dependent catalytic subunit